MEDSPRRMVRAAASFFSGTLLSRISGLLRDIAMAFAFGTDPALAGFFVAFRLAHLLRRLFGESTLQSTFIPHFETLRSQKNSHERATALFIHLYIVLSLFLCLLVGFVFLGYGAFQGYLTGWSSSIQEIVFLSLLMLPSLIFICLSGLNAALLQCEKSYFLPSIAPVAFNAIWIIGVLLLHHLTPSQAMPKLALCIVLACCCQWLVTLPKVISIVCKYTKPNFSLILPKNVFSEDLLKLWKPFFLGMIGIGATQINSLCDTFFAAYADRSGPAYLWYAIRLQQLPLALFGIGLSGALLPPLTRAIKKSEDAHSHLLLKSAIECVIIFILPMTIALLLFGRRSIDLLYGYGDFGKDSIAGTTHCLWGYVLGLVPMALVLIAAPIFYAKNNYRIPTSASVNAMILNLCLNMLFIFGFGWMTPSIAIATSLSSIYNLGHLITSMDTLTRTVFLEAMRGGVYQIGWSLLLASASSWWLSDLIPIGNSIFEKGIYLGTLAVLFTGIFALGSFSSIVRMFYKKNSNSPEF